MVSSESAPQELSSEWSQYVSTIGLNLLAMTVSPPDHKEVIKFRCGNSVVEIPV
jgi:hypothetical protein